MQLKSKKYWEKRSEQVMSSAIKDADEFLGSLKRQYYSAIDEIEGDISKWYLRYSRNDGISFSDAKKVLDARELDELKWDVKTYIKYGKQNAINGKWIKQLERASTRAHISRLEALLLHIRQQAEVLAKYENDGLTSLAKKVYKDSFYKTAYNFAVGTNIGLSLTRIDNDRLMKVVSKPWSADGKVFSERIWEDRDKLVTTLENELSQNIIRGLSPRDSIKRISEKFDVSLSNAKRLVNTESAYFCSAATEDTFHELSVEKFQIVATLDNRTSEICQDMDGTILPISQFEPGVTAPPFHPNCRSTTIPYIDNNYGDRISRDSKGKALYVPNTMTYKEWKEKFVK